MLLNWTHLGYQNASDREAIQHFLFWCALKLANKVSSDKNGIMMNLMGGIDDLKDASI